MKTWQQHQPRRSSAKMAIESVCVAASMAFSGMQQRISQRSQRSGGVNIQQRLSSYGENNSS